MDKTLLKGLRMLEVLGSSGGQRGLTDLAAELGLTKSNVHRTLKTLEAAGYVRRDTSGGHYRLSLKVWEIGCQVLETFDFKREAREHLDQLADKTRETVHLSILDGVDVVYLDKIDSPEPVRAYSKVGGRAPAYAVATGKALLAYQSKEVIERVGTHLTPFSDRTIRNLDQLVSELRRVRSRSYAVNMGEWRASIWGVAAPIFGASGAVEGAIGISGPAERLKSKKISQLAPLVVAEAAALSAKLGYLGLESKHISSRIRGATLTKHGHCPEAESVKSG